MPLSSAPRSTPVTETQAPVTKVAPPQTWQALHEMRDLLNGPLAQVRWTALADLNKSSTVGTLDTMLAQQA